MAEPIIITMEDGKEYKLEFDRKSVAFSERIGFSVFDVQEKLMTRIPELFWVAFRKNHPDITQEQAEHILFDELGGTWDALTERLVELYTDAYTSLINDEGKPKNPKVRILM